MNACQSHVAVTRGCEAEPHAPCCAVRKRWFWGKGGVHGSSGPGLLLVLAPPVSPRFITGVGGPCPGSSSSPLLPGASVSPVPPASTPTAHRHTRLGGTCSWECVLALPARAASIRQDPAVSLGRPHYWALRLPLETSEAALTSDRGPAGPASPRVMGLLPPGPRPAPEGLGML